MDNMRLENIEVLDRIIIGRVEPHIYAFSTNTVPNYLKVGDTYRPVSQRLKEWKLYFPDLEKQYESKAIIDDKTYFRDYAIHQYLEQDLRKERLKVSDLDADTYYSKEFFKEIQPEDIDSAIVDIKNNFSNHTGKYEYYSSENRLPERHHYERGENWTLRPNQANAVTAFSNAVNSGRRNLLMYAVMRFGKSFTSFCCALAIKACVVLVVSGKADVKDEWKKTVEGAGNFREYIFLDGYDLASDENIIEENRLKNKKVVIFLTLQDLQGDEIKDKHRELFNEQIDLLIVDETHFGARAESFGKIIENAGYEKSDISNLNRLEDENIDINAAEIELKQINARIRLHLSGTPYRILMGHEFQKEDIISFVQFSDIVNEQKEWDRINLNRDEINEWDNPYYGFPQMIRFAFNPNQASRLKLESLKKSGVTFAFSKLFEPNSIKKDRENNRHKLFKNEQEILELLQVIDGSKLDENLLGFLDYDKIKEGKMCRHMVMVLPYCASCDAMEELLRQHKNTFKNFGDYEIINISGVDSTQKYKKPSDIKNKIKECEKLDRKTLTLTVNRMLTGATVEEWDTMLYFKDTASPQEYDQAIFRLQNQYVRILTGENGIIKENLKPQTVLVDFNPDRLFRMQEQKSLIYNVNTEENGNRKLKQRIAEELQISPIIIMNHNNIKEVNATNILEAISEYNNQRSISDEVLDIPVDLSILNDETVRATIEKQGGFNSKQGLTIDPNQGDGDDFDIEKPEKSIKKTKNATKNTDPTDYINEKNKDEIRVLESQIKTYYQRLLFFSFLTKNRVSSIDDILSVIDNEDNIRLSNNLALDKTVVEKIGKIMDPFKRSRLDYKIQNISMLASDSTIEPLKRALISIKKFNRMSESEIITPSKVCDKMVSLLTEQDLKEIVENQDKFLDIASKSGEYTVSLYNRLTSGLGYSHEIVKDLFYSIPTSSIAYEFTRKFYEILGLNVENIAIYYNAYDLINIKNDDDQIDCEKISSILKQKRVFSTITLDGEIEQGAKKVKFGAVIGNPPYQEIISKSEGNRSLGKQLFPNFIKLSVELTDKYVSLITPSKWFTADAQDNSFPKLRDYFKDDECFVRIHVVTNGGNLFQGAELGSINYFLYDKNHKGDVTFVNDDGSIQMRPLFEDGMSQIIPLNSMVSILKKVINSERFVSLTTITKGRNAFGLTGKQANDITTECPKEGDFEVRCSYERIRYISKSKINKNLELANKYKVFMSKANGAAGILGENREVSVLGKPYLGSKGTICTDSLIPIGEFDNEFEMNNLYKYLQTKFLRFMVGILKSSQNTTQIVYRFAPIQDFTDKSDIDWTKSIPDIDDQLFKKYKFSEEECKHINKSIKDI